MTRAERLQELQIEALERNAEQAQATAEDAREHNARIQANHDACAGSQAKIDDDSRWADRINTTF